MASFQNSLTIEKAISGVQIKRFQKENGFEGLASCLSEMIIATVLYFGSEINPSLAVMISNDILDKYPYETIEDLLQGFKMIRRGELTESYDSRTFTPNKFIEVWLPRYFNKKSQAFEKLKHNEGKEKTKELTGDGWTNEKLSELKKSVDKKANSFKSVPIKALTQSNEIKSLKDKCKFLSLEEINKLITTYKNHSTRPDLFKDQINILQTEIKRRK